ncbi:MAG: hypothetical protein IKC16_00200 [Clostridia bacterium]|nr:hypothetical protein [Clostridia bacterium]
MSNHNKVKAILLSTVIAISLLISACLAGCSTPKDTSATNTQTQDTQTDSSNTEKPPVESDTNTDKPADSEADTNTDTSTPVTPDVPVEPENTTFEEFMAEHITIANQFALDQIEQISYSDKALSTSYSFVANENNLEKIIVAQVVAGEGETRELKIAEISFAGGADFDDIIDGEVEFVPVITSETALAFDAKEEFLKGDSSTIEDQIAEEINETLGDNAIQHEEYKPETFTPETVEELAQMYPEKVNKTLTDRFLAAVLKKDRFTSLDAALVHNAKWIMKGDKDITDVDIVFHYGDENGKGVYAINLKFSSPLTIENVLTNDKNLQSITTTRTQKFFFDYNPSIQGTRDELMNAIFKANGMSETCPEGAVRLIKIADSASIDTEMGYRTRKVDVVEIGENKIQKFTVCIKDENNNATDVQLINNLNKGLYRMPENISIDISGIKVEYVAIAVEDANG